MAIAPDLVCAIQSHMAAASKSFSTEETPNVVEGDDLIGPTHVADKPLIVCGTDRRGRPVLIARPSLHVAATEDESLQAAEECMKTVQQSVQCLPDGEEQLLAVFDLKGTGFEHLDMTFSQSLLGALNRELPNRLEKVAVVNGHWSVHAAWCALKVFLDETTQRKIHFYDELSDLEQMIDSDHPYMKRLRTKGNGGQKPTGAALTDEPKSWSWW